MRACRFAAFGLALSTGAISGLAIVAATSGAALAQGTAAPVAAKPVALTQSQIDGAIAAQKDMSAVEAKQPQKPGDEKPDPKVEAQLTGIAKKNGFADMEQYAGVSATIGTVMAGIDPETKAYVGPMTVIRKQIAEVQADTKMPAKEKSEALEELKAAMATTSSDKPSQSNIDLVTKNFDALSQAMGAE